jgi:low temperature requirement protein LtrA
MVTIWDVRYTADSVFERCCRAVQLGTMVGFAELGTAFDPKAQIRSVFQTTSVFLAISRITLGAQYGVLAWQIRDHQRSKKPMMITAALHFTAAVIYLGLSFSYISRENSLTYIFWYITGIAEMGLHLGLSQIWKVLSFKGTHFGERMNLLTLIILGEGRCPDLNIGQILAHSV